jgi:hypothetical protein
LDLLLDLTAEAVGVTEGDLNFTLLSLREVADVRFPRERGGESRLPFRGIVRRGNSRVQEPVHVVDNSRRRVAEQSVCQCVRNVRCIEGVDLCLCEIGGETREGIAQALCGLAHDSGTGHQTEDIEADCGAIAVGIRHQVRREHPIVVRCRNHVAGGLHGVCRLHHQEIVGIVIVDRRSIAEWILKPARQEEMLQSLVSFLG